MDRDAHISPAYGEEHAKRGRRPLPRILLYLDLLSLYQDLMSKLAELRYCLWLSAMHMVQ